MGETRDHLEEHGCAGMVHCQKLGHYIADLCSIQCGAECPEWQEADPGPDEEPAPVGAPGQVRCQRLGKYLNEQCADCPDKAGWAGCPWLANIRAEEPAPPITQPLGGFYCWRQCEYVPARCEDCQDHGRCAAATPHPITQAPADGDLEPLLRYLNYLESVLTLPFEKQMARAPLMAVMREQAVRVVEERDKLYAEVERLKPIVEGMKLLETIEKLRAEVARLTGIADAARGTIRDLGGDDG